jgi:hypothetical protein
MEDGCDYFYQVNDDIKFISPNWSEDFVSNLKSTKLYLGKNFFHKFQLNC